MLNPEALKPITILTAYSQDDEDRYHELEVHLAGIRRRGLIKDWLIRRIEPSIEWKQAQTSFPLVEQADLILLLISQDFIESGYCESSDMKRL